MRDPEDTLIVYNQKIIPLTGLEGQTINVRGMQIRLDTILGAGGNGIVYRGELRSHAPIDVAVKLSNDPARDKQIGDEVKLLRRLDNSYISKPIGYGFPEINGGKRGALVMNYVDGLELATISRLHSKLGREMPAKYIGLLGFLMSEALVHAHGQELIHRDLSPRNVIVKRTEGCPVIIDFGTGILSQDSPETIGETIGTLGFIDRSILDGQETDYRVDLYGLGMNLYALAKGSNPLLSTLEPGISSREAITRVKAEQDDWDQKLKRERNIDPGLLEIIINSTKQDRDDRYNDILMMQAALGAYVYGDGGFGITKGTLKDYFDELRVEADEAGIKY